MDYDIINQVYGEIIEIVNAYVRRTKCSYEVARKLSFALFGYYLVMGPEIFKKINVVLDAVHIYETTSEDEYCKKVDITRFHDGYDVEVKCNPVTMWEYKIDSNNKFLGGVPKIVYMCSNDSCNVLSIVHELSHVLEGVDAVVTREDREYVYIKQGFANVVGKKASKYFKIEDGGGFSELAAISLENRVLKEMLKLDVEQIVSPLLKEFLNGIQQYKEQNAMAKSYMELSTTFKDFIDNDTFFALLKKYFYEADEEGFKAEYESLSPALNYSSLKHSADVLAFNLTSLKQLMIYIDIVLKQVGTFSLATGFVQEKKLLILV